jgi:hypothetical protein
MRWIVGALLALLVATVVYVGAAIMALGTLATAVREGDAETILRMTDRGALRRNLAEQFVGAYLDELEAERRLTQAQRATAGSLAWTYGEAIIDAFISADGVRFLLGRADAPAGGGPFRVAPGDFARLVGSGTEDPLGALARLRPINITEIGFRVGSGVGAETTEVRLRFRRLSWRLGGVTMPREAVKAAVRALPRS